MSDAAASFEPHRRYLVGVAYRMLGSVADADDAVQDAFLRWQGVDRTDVGEPRAYLARVVTRLCLDRLSPCRLAGPLPRRGTSRVSEPSPEPSPTPAPCRRASAD